MTSTARQHSRSDSQPGIPGIGLDRIAHLIPRSDASSTITQSPQVSSTSVYTGPAISSWSRDPTPSVTPTGVTLIWPHIDKPNTSAAPSTVVIIVATVGGTLVLSFAIGVLYFIRTNKKAKNKFTFEAQRLDDLESGAPKV
ncbi:hypothetical protein TWF694_006452 [Orbilia ellipsospora]|uniref:Uncharacterized protein n=1 Tax=Orbilia ellipsospora TaxID=2528407 RepID=A0AAV9XK94_9PEZI